MTERIGIIRKATRWVYGSRGNPLDGLGPEEVINFFEEHKRVLADPVIAAFKESYPPEIPDNQIPEEDKQLFMDAWDAQSKFI